jgi:hypothetical protein
VDFETPTSVVLRIEVSEPAVEEDRDAMARQLLREIREDLPEFAAADLVSAEAAQAGAKSGELVTIGAVAVSILPALVPQLVEFVRAWSLRGRGRTVRMKFDAHGVEVEFDPASMSPAEIAALVANLGESTRSKIGEPQASDSAPPSTIRIFLASSTELREDRDALDLYLRQLNDTLSEARKYLRVVRWENFLDAMSETRMQDGYNDAVRSCDIFISLFFTKTGQYTREEFHVAHSHFLDTGRPYIYTFFKDAEIRTGNLQRADLTSLWDFQEELKALGHFYTRYHNIDHLKRLLRDQLDKLDI